MPILMSPMTTLRCFHNQPVLRGHQSRELLTVPPQVWGRDRWQLQPQSKPSWDHEVGQIHTP